MLGDKTITKKAMRLKLKLDFMFGLVIKRLARPGRLGYAREEARQCERV